LGDFNLYRERQEVFDQIAAYDEAVKGINFTGIDPPEQLRRLRVSVDYFSLFGAHIGSNFHRTRGPARRAPRRRHQSGTPKSPICE
jgi:hypothetical protein